MEALLEFGQGPLFKFSFAVMVLGLIRLFALGVIGMGEALAKAGDRTVPYGDLIKTTLGWLFPVLRLWKSRPVYSLVSFLFHIGLVVVPIFLAAHIVLWREGLGFGWPAMPRIAADILTLLVIVTGPALFIGRLASKESRFLSRRQDYIWPILLTVPALTGYIAGAVALSASAYQWTMLIHVYAGNLIFLMIPFTKIAHCVLMPLTHVASGIAWRFPVGAGEQVAETLGKKGQPI